VICVARIRACSSVRTATIRCIADRIPVRLGEDGVLIAELALDHQITLASVGTVDVGVISSSRGRAVLSQTDRYLKVPEQSCIGVELGKVLAVKCRYWVNLDTDSTGRITAIEIPAPPAEFKAALVARAQG
jgi:hypothetical protein